MSIHDVPEIREIFSGFDFEEVTLSYAAGAKDSKKAWELVISNQSLDELSIHTP